MRQRASERKRSETERERRRVSQVTHHAEHDVECDSGTRDYAAPEVIKLSQLPADSQLGDAYGPEVDVWSVGVILFAMLCGYLPFQSDSKVELFRLIVCGEYSFAEEQWSEVSAGAKDLVCNMLVVDPKRRFSAKQCLGHDWLCKTASSRIHPAEKAESGPHRDYGHDVAGSHISPVRQTRTTVDSAAAGMDQNKEMRSRKKASCAVGLQKWLAWFSHRRSRKESNANVRIEPWDT